MQKKWNMRIACPVHRHQSKGDELAIGPSAISLSPSITVWSMAPWPTSLLAASSRSSKIGRKKSFSQPENQGRVVTTCAPELPVRNWSACSTVRNFPSKTSSMNAAVQLGCAAPASVPANAKETGHVDRWPRPPASKYKETKSAFGPSATSLSPSITVWSMAPWPTRLLAGSSRSSRI